jgi:Thioesterase domain
LEGRETIDTGVEQMAAHYRQEIQALQPRGPYFLGGYCLGGTIALEIAQQLRRSGESVALLAMMETYNMEDVGEFSFPLRTFHRAQNLYFHLKNLLLSLSRGGLGFFLEKLRVQWSRSRVKRNILWATMLDKLGYESGLRYQHLHVRDVNDRAQAAYKPLPYDGKITLFRTQGHYRGLDSWDFGWGRIARHGVRVVELPHYPRGSLNRPFVEVLVRRLAAEIEDTRSGLLRAGQGW